MPAFHKYKLLHIHIPKTGGTAIEKFLHSVSDVEPGTQSWIGVGHQNGRWYEYQHLSILELYAIAGTRFPDYSSFSVVRDPYTRLISDFLWRKKVERYFPNSDTVLFNSFSDFLEAIPADIDTNWQAHIRSADRKSASFLIHTRPQYQFLYDDQSSLLVNDILRYENLDQELNRYLFRLSLHTDKIYAPVIHSVKDYYNGAQIAKVNRIYARDFEFFRYTKIGANNRNNSAQDGITSGKENDIKENTNRIPPMVVQFHRALADQKQFRQKQLGELLARSNRDKVVLVMMANSGYNDVFNNWVASCDMAGLDVRSWSVLFAVDDDAAANATKKGFRTFLDRNSYGNQPSEAVKAFADGNFRKLMFQKTAIVQDVLELGYDVLFQDVDMVWLKNPMDYFVTTERLKWDASFMYDGPNRMHAPLHANTGFFFLNNCQATRTFWTTVLHSYDRMFKGGSQQAVVNSILADCDIRVDILPEKHFANGHLFSTKGPSRLPVDPYVIHCSWTGNREHKLQKYQRHGLWFI